MGDLRLYGIDPGPVTMKRPGKFRSGSEGAEMATHRSIIVGVDGSEPSFQAVSWGAREASLRKIPLSLVTTVPGRGTAGIPIGMPAAFFEQEELDGRQRLAEAAKHASDTVAGVQIESHLCTGPPAAELIERSHAAVLVVLGAGRRSVVERALLGSVAATVVTHACGPVVIVQDLPYISVSDLSGPIIVGVDGSDCSARAVKAAFEEASLHSTELVAVHVWSDAEMNLPFRRTLDWGGTEARERAALTENLAAYAQQYPEVRVRAVVALDRPVRQLQNFADGAQLVVVGSRGRGGFANMRIGSTTRMLLHTVSCPLMIVP